MPVKGPEKSVGKPMEKRHVHAAGVALMRLLDDRILVVRRSQHEKRAPGHYELPGGKLEGSAPNGQAKNTIEMQVAREVEEETKISVRPEDMVYSENEIIDEPHRIITAMRYLAVFPSGQKVDVRNIRRDKDHDAYEFVRAENYEKLNYVSGVREFLTKLFTKQMQKGTLLVNVNPLFEYCVNFVFVDPRERRVLLTSEPHNPEFGFSLPSTEVTQWEHLHDGILQGTRTFFEGKSVSTEECWGRRVLVKQTEVKRPLIRGELKRTQLRWDFVYLLYIPELFGKTQTHATKGDYQWVGFRDDALTRECEQLQARGLERNDILGVFKQILNLSPASKKKELLGYRDRMYPILPTTDDQKDELASLGRK